MLTMNTKFASVAVFLLLWSLLSGLFSLWENSSPSLLLLAIVTLPFASYITALMFVYLASIKPSEAPQIGLSA
ncbi:hypothetical protein [Thiomicrorhabdus arctica]|uniref:hypothetical protein n=1 Tax=Thiomicrorhabdus arctica TaxID=131540 RepID=UPI0003722724|nr:hypothetical protein [Thiomicrorhabdus arctica]